MIGTYRSTGSNVGSQIRRVVSARQRMEYGKKSIDYKDKVIRSRTKAREAGQKQVTRVQEALKTKTATKVAEAKSKGQIDVIKHEQKLAETRGEQQRKGYEAREQMYGRERTAKLQYYRQRKAIESGGDDK